MKSNPMPFVTQPIWLESNKEFILNNDFILTSRLAETWGQITRHYVLWQKLDGVGPWDCHLTERLKMLAHFPMDKKIRSNCLSSMYSHTFEFRKLQDSPIHRVRGWFLRLWHRRRGWRRRWEIRTAGSSEAFESRQEDECVWEITSSGN